MSSKPWFAWFPADYRAKTAHLTFEQDGAYRRMLDAYYERRGPLPTQPEALYRLCSAQSESERKSVDYVAKQYFRENGGELHHTRCDEQIEREKAIHNKWVESGRKGGLRQAQGRLKGRGKGASTISDSDSHSSLNPKTSTTLSGRPDVAKRVLQFLNDKTGRHYKPVKANIEMIVARLNDGATEIELNQVVAKKCREWAGDEKMAIYLRPATLFNRTKFAQYQGELLCAAPTATAN